MDNHIWFFLCYYSSKKTIVENKITFTKTLEINNTRIIDIKNKHIIFYQRQVTNTKYLKTNWPETE